MNGTVLGETSRTALRSSLFQCHLSSALRAVTSTTDAENVLNQQVEKEDGTSAAGQRRWGDALLRAISRFSASEASAGPCFKDRLLQLARDRALSLRNALRATSNPIADGALLIPPRSVESACVRPVL